MARDLTVGPEAFASGMQNLLGSVSKAGPEALAKGLKEGAKTTRKEWSRDAPKRRPEYCKTIRLKVDSTGDKPKVTVYSTMPGLTHLLEKGHATLGGGRVAARPHIAPAASDGFDKAMEATLQAWDEEISK